MRTVTIDQFLTPDEIETAIKLYKQLAGTGKFARILDEEVISPNIKRINTALGQSNNSRYLAYLVEFVLSRKTPSL